MLSSHCFVFEEEEVFKSWDRKLRRRRLNTFLRTRVLADKQTELTFKLASCCFYSIVCFGLLPRKREFKLWTRIFGQLSWCLRQTFAQAAATNWPLFFSLFSNPSINVWTGGEKRKNQSIERIANCHRDGQSEQGKEKERGKRQTAKQQHRHTFSLSLHLFGQTHEHTNLCCGQFEPALFPSLHPIFFSLSNGTISMQQQQQQQSRPIDAASVCASVWVSVCLIRSSLEVS